MKWSNRVRCVLGLLFLLEGSTSKAFYLPDAHSPYGSTPIDEFLLYVPNIVNDMAAPDWVTHLDLGGAYFNNDPTGRGIADLFVPLNRYGPHLFYGDVRAYKRSGEGMEGNFALGYRYLFQGHRPDKGVDYAYTNNWEVPWNMVGIYVSYDGLLSEAENWFNQVSTGVEFWHERFFVGANGYFPVGETNRNDADENAAYATHPIGSDVPASGIYGNIFYAKGHEQALPGFDGEVGYNIWQGLSIFAGGYYFHDSDVSTVSGPKATLEYVYYPQVGTPLLHVFSRITFDTEIKHDNPRGTTWSAGLKATINLSHKRSRLEGVARHMVDPIRRDVDMITQRYHDPFQPFRMNGRIANVKYVSSAAGAASAADNADVDIIAVNGAITGVSTLELSDGLDQGLTGGDFEFAAEGTNFVVHQLGRNGTLTAAEDAQLIEVGPGDNTLNIQHIGLNTNSTNSTTSFAPEIAIGNYNGTDYNAFGHLILKDVRSTGALDIRVPSGISTVSVQDSVFNVAFGSATTENSAAVRFEADGGSTLIIDQFSNVDINSSSITSVHGPLYGLFNYALGGNVVYTAAPSTNIVVNGDAVTTKRVSGVRNEATSGYSVIFEKGFSHNTIEVTSTNTGDRTAGLDNAVSASTIEFDGPVDNNPITVNGSGLVYGVINAVSGAAGDIFYNSTFSGNTITATSSAGNVFGLANEGGGSAGSMVVFSGDMIGNVVTAMSSGSGTAETWYNHADGSSILYRGALIGNSLTATGTTGRAEVFYNQASGSGSDIIFSGVFRGNVLKATTTSGDIDAWHNDAMNGAAITFQSAIAGNPITARATTGDMTVWNNDADGGNITYQGAITSNILEGDTTTGNINVWYNGAVGADILYSGVVTGNKLFATIGSETTPGNSATMALGLSNYASAGEVTFSSLFSGQIIRVKNYSTNTTSNTVGIQNSVVAGDSSINYLGGFANNSEISASGNGFKVGMLNTIDTNGANASINFAGLFGGNTISAGAISSDTGTQSIGILNEISDNGSIIYGGNFLDNTITATSIGGDAYGMLNQIEVVANAAALIQMNAAGGEFSDNILSATTTSATGEAQAFSGLISASSDTSSDQILLNGSFLDNQFLASGPEGVTDKATAGFYLYNGASSGGARITLGASSSTTLFSGNTIGGATAASSNAEYGIYMVASDNAVAGTQAIIVNSQLTGNTLNLLGSSSKGGMVFVGVGTTGTADANIQILNSSSAELTANNTLNGGSGSVVDMTNGTGFCTGSACSP